MEKLHEKIIKDVNPALMKQFNYQCAMQVPAVKKVVVNMGLGEALQDAKVIDQAVKQLAVITGQKPLVTKARKSIATFKLRKGLSIGASVTLRKERMYAFLNRLINVALPRVKDFKGLSSKGMDGRGNFSLGIKEQIIFPEIDYDSIDKVRGMNISIVTTAKTDEEGLGLLKAIGIPFRN